MPLIVNGVDIKQPNFNEKSIDKIICNGITVFQKAGEVVYPYRNGGFYGSGAMIPFCANGSGSSGVPAVAGTLLTPHPDSRYIWVTVNEDISSLTLSFGSGSNSGIQGEGGTMADLYKNGLTTNLRYCHKWFTGQGRENLAVLSHTLYNLKAGDVACLYIRNGPSASTSNYYNFYSPTFVATK